MGRTAKARYRRRRRARGLRFAVFDLGGGFMALFSDRTRLTTEQIEALKEMVETDPFPGSRG